MSIKRILCTIICLFFSIYAHANNALDDRKNKFSAIEGKKNQLLKNLPDISVYKMHLGMTMDEILSSYPNGQIKYFIGSGKDAAGNSWAIRTNNIEEIRNIKYGPYEGIGKYTGKLYDPGTDRIIDFTFNYEGYLQSVSAMEPFDKELNCTAIDKKLRNKYGDKVIGYNGKPEKTYDASKNYLIRRWLTGNVSNQDYAKGKRLRYTLSADVRGCMDAANGSSITFKLSSPSLAKLSSDELKAIMEVDKQVEILNAKNRGAVPDF